MLTLKRLVEIFDLTRETLQSWHHDEKDLDLYLSYFRISSNAIYPFRQNGQLRFLRLTPVKEKRLTNIRGKLEFIWHLCENKQPGLELLPSKNSEQLLTLNGIYYATAL